MTYECECGDSKTDAISSSSNGVLSKVVVWPAPSSPQQGAVERESLTHSKGTIWLESYRDTTGSSETSPGPLRVKITLRSPLSANQPHRSSFSHILRTEV